MELQQFQNKCSSQPIRVLLVDDNPHFLKLMAVLLSVDSRFEIVGTALSGREALAEIKRLEPDLVLLDVAMPDINGLELTRHLKKHAAAPRIIIVTTYDDAEYHLAARGANADGFVAKSDLSLKLWPTIYALFQ